MRKELFKKDDFVVTQGFSSDAWHIFLNGKAQILIKNKEGQEVIISILSPGDYVGEMSLIDQTSLGIGESNSSIRCINFEKSNFRTFHACSIDSYTQNLVYARQKATLRK